MSTPTHSGEAITILKVEPREDLGIILTSPSQGPDGRLEDRHSAYRGNLSPPLNWTEVEGAEAYALVVEDPDAPRAHPFVHWMIWDIPGQARSLPEGLANTERLTTPYGAIQGPNDSGSHGWFGPRPPVGHGLHRYYFQLFALDQILDMGPQTRLPDLLNALKGHTLAQGEMMATFEAPLPQ